MKNLKIKVEERFDGFVGFKVVEQSHRNKEFGKNGASFVASNGVELNSLNCPCWASFKTLFVRGGVPWYDNDLIVVKEKDFKMIEVAIAEYNEFFKN